MRIEGQDGNVLGVNAAGEAYVRALTPWQAAVDRGDAFIFHGPDKDIAAAGTVLALRNDNPNRVLVIDRILITNGNVATQYEVHKITAAYVSTGDAVAGLNANGAFADIANLEGVTCHADETGETQGAIFLVVGAGVVVEQYGPYQIDMKLLAGQAIGIDQVTDSTAGAATIFAYFEDK